MAAVLGGGIGSFAMGVFVLLNEAGLFTAPALYGPAGGVTGRTTFATIVWLLAWGVLHARWRSREVTLWTGVHVDRRTCRAGDRRHVSTSVGFAVIAGNARWQPRARRGFARQQQPDSSSPSTVRCATP